MDTWELLTEIGILLGASLVLGGIALKLGFSPLIGYLLAGIFLGGPGSIHLIKSPAEIETIAELGVSLLLFSLGLEFSWSKIKRFPLNTLQAGVLQIIFTPLVTTLICYLLNIEFKIGILLGLIFTLSSTATVLRTLVDLTEIDSIHGRNSIAVLLLQDIAVVPFTIIVSFLAFKNQISAGSGNNFFLVMGGAITLVIVLYILLNRVAGPVLSLFTLENNREMAMLLAVITGIGSAWIAHSIGISPAIGSFIAGMLLGASPFATQIRADVSPLRTIFLTLFFGSAGMVANPVWISENFLLVISVTAAVMFSKTIVSTLIFKLCNNTLAIALSSGLCIAQIGEFAFVLGNLAKEINVIPEDIHQLVISVTIVSLLITPFIIKSAPAIGLYIHRLFFYTLTKSSKRIQDKQITMNQVKCVRPEIFILGYGPSGNEVAAQLKQADKKIAVIDLNQECLNRARAEGFECHIGDVRQIEILQHYGLSYAQLVVITIPSYEASIKAIDNVRRLAPNTYIIVRSRYQAHAIGFERAGAHVVINEEFTVGQKLAESVFQYLNEEL